MPNPSGIRLFHVVDTSLSINQKLKIKTDNGEVMMIADSNLVYNSEDQQN
ncbi:hypothetical protein [Bacillus sp. T33-2]|nr:hypothetical protein [Bacillus sp. T33-2]